MHEKGWNIAIMNNSDIAIPINLDGVFTGKYYYNELIVDKKTIDILSHNSMDVQCLGAIEYSEIKQRERVKQESRYYIKRDLDDRLAQLYNRHKDEQYILFVDGPRLTGKTHLIERYALRHYDSVLHMIAINFQSLEGKSFYEELKRQNENVLSFEKSKNTVLIIDDIYSDLENLVKWVQEAGVAFDVIFIYSQIIPTDLRVNITQNSNYEAIRVHSLTYKEISNDELAREKITKDIYRQIGGRVLTVASFLKSGNLESAIVHAQETVEQLISSTLHREENIIVKYMTSIVNDSKTYNYLEELQFTWGASDSCKWRERLLTLGIVENERGQLKFTDYSFLHYLSKKISRPIEIKDYKKYNKFVLDSLVV